MGPGDLVDQGVTFTDRQGRLGVVGLAGADIEQRVGMGQRDFGLVLNLAVGPAVLRISKLRSSSRRTQEERSCCSGKKPSTRRSPPLSRRIRRAKDGVRRKRRRAVMTPKAHKGSRSFLFVYGRERGRQPRTPHHGFRSAGGLEPATSGSR
jgi:hypothetical protein